MSINLELLKQARQNIYSMDKLAFMPAGDPAMGGAPPMDPAMGGAPPMDPAMGGAPPMDPAMGGAPPMDPAMGGAPPMDPAMGGAPPADPLAALAPMIQSAVQQAMAASGNAQSGPQAGGGGIKPKIDVNVEIMQIKKILAKIVDALGIPIPAADMVATPEDLNQIAQGGAGFAAVTPEDKGGGGLGQISPVEPMKAAQEAWESGVAFDHNFNFESSQRGMQNVATLAAAMAIRNRVQESN
jgi:hypothetical protein